MDAQSLGRRPDIADRLPAVAALMHSTIPDSLVTGFESLIPSLSLPDPQDRHVLAVAIAGHADAIVTFNLDDFPQERSDPFADAATCAALDHRSTRRGAAAGARHAPSTRSARRALNARTRG